jgi:chemotaxis protein methyltransferase CheR
VGRDVEQTPATVLSRDALAFLSRASDLELSAYREEHVAERVRRALARQGVTGVDELARLLARDPEARSRFRRSVAVSASGLFRDRPQFALLERELLPPLSVDGRRRLRVWSAGCADGTELYSVAMVLDKLGVLERAFLLGSDLLEENLAAARRGVYGAQMISSRLRGHARWEHRDLLRDGAAPGHWQLILCRNVAIYLCDDAKRFLYQALTDSLTVGGVLLLGRSERIADAKSMRLERVGPHAYRRRT